MGTETLENDEIRVAIDVDQTQARVELNPGGQAWEFTPNPDGDVWVKHGQTDAVAYLREAPRKTVRRVRTQREERVTVFLQGLAGNTGVSVTFAVAPRGATLRVEVESLPTGSSSVVREARFPGPLSFVNTNPEYTVWPNAAGMLLPNRYGNAVSPDGEGLARVQIPYGRIDWSTREDFRNVDILARVHEAWGTTELVNHRILDADGLAQEFEYPDGKVTVDLKESRYRVEGGPLETRDWTRVQVERA